MLCYTLPIPEYLFFANGVPALLYYAHIPATVLSLLIGIFVLSRGPRLLLNRLLFAISVCFSVWTFCSLITWTNVDSDVVIFVWSLFGIISAALSILCVYFIYVFLNNGKDVSFVHKVVFSLLVVPAIVLTPTSFDLSGFNLDLCGSSGYENLGFVTYYTALGIVAMLWSLFLFIRYFWRAGKVFQKEIVLMAIGIEFFLLSFFVAEFLASYLNDIGVVPDYSLEQYGLFGMVVFMALIGLMIVRFKAFNASMIATQALVIALLFLIGAQFAFIASLTYRIVIGITFLLTATTGVMLIRSVKREIQQREEIEQLAMTLEQANQRQESLLHFVGHEVKGFLTKDMGAFASLAEGDFGPLSDTMKPFIEGALKQSRDGANSVIDILQASNQKKGTITYNKAPFDFKELVGEWVAKLKPVAEAKSLTFNLSIDTVGDTCTVNGDRGQIGDHVLRNLIENAINYTPSGSITLSLAKKNGKIEFAVADTGVGINDEDKKRLFTEGGKGKDSLKVNVHSTGYGLFIAKNIVDAHGGTIRAESEGTGKGSRFIVELPAA